MKQSLKLHGILFVAGVFFILLAFYLPTGWAGKLCCGVVGSMLFWLLGKDAYQVYFVDLPLQKRQAERRAKSESKNAQELVEAAIKHATRTPVQIAEDLYKEESEKLKQEVKEKRWEAQRKVHLEELRAQVKNQEAIVRAERRPPPPEPTKEDEASVSQYLSDREIEQLVLRAFRRIGSLPFNEQDDAWNDWEADIAAEYDDYVTGEILMQAQELRSE